MSTDLGDIHSEERRKKKSACFVNDKPQPHAPLELLGVGGAAHHFADGLDNGVAVDAVDFEQLMRFAAAGDVGHSQTVQVEALLIHHHRAQGFTKTSFIVVILHGQHSSSCGTAMIDDCFVVQWFDSKWVNNPNGDPLFLQMLSCS